MVIDGNIVDIATIIVGVASSAVRPVKRYFTKTGPYFHREKAISDMLNGVMLAPFSMMVGSIFSSDLMQELIASAKITLAIAGLSGLFFVLGELFKEN
jgi:Na+/H+ antiporter NhaC